MSKKAKSVNPVETQKTTEQVQEQKLKNKKIADKYANTKGKEEINEITEEAVRLYNNDETRQMGKALMQETISDLAKLILYQEIYEMSLNKTYDLVERTNDGYISNGNAKEYFVDLPTGNETYNAQNFNPTKHTLKKLEKYFIQLYDEKGGLNKKAYQFLKELTLTEAQYIPYFLSGKLNDYLNILRNQIYKVFKIFKSNKLFDIITTTTPNKQIQGNAENMFDALVLEVIPEIEKMMELNSVYNVVDSKFINTCNPEDIVILMSTKNKSMIKNGIKTQLYNAELLGASGKTLIENNIYSLGNKMRIGNQDAIIEDTGTQWIDDNTIIVLDISKVKSIMQVNTLGTMYYPKNLTQYIALHIWGAMDILPWAKMFKYTNTNLSKLPK